MCRYHQQSEQWVVYVTWNLNYCGVWSICFTPTGRKNVWSCGCCEVRPETWNLICVMPHPFSILSTALKCIVQRIHPLLPIEEMNLPRGNILWIGLCGFLRYLHYSKTLQQQSLMLDAASRQHAVVLSASMSALHSRDLAWEATVWFRQWDGMRNSLVKKHCERRCLACITVTHCLCFAYSGQMKFWLIVQSRTCTERVVLAFLRPGLPSNRCHVTWRGYNTLFWFCQILSNFIQLKPVRTSRLHLKSSPRCLLAE